MQQRMPTTIVVLALLASVLAGVCAVEVVVSTGAGVQMELSSLSAIYGRAEDASVADAEADADADADSDEEGDDSSAELVETDAAAETESGHPKSDMKVKLLNMAKSVDTTIKSSAQEEWGCCRVCDDMDELVQKIPPPLEPEYGHNVREQRRHVAPERGFQDFMPPMVSCCPTCLWPPKVNPEAKRVPTFRGDMETEVSTFARGDGPTDAQTLAGAADSDRVKEFAKFDAPNYRKPDPELVSGWKSREAARTAAKEAAEHLDYARKYYNAEGIEAAENAMYNHVFTEIFGAAYTDDAADDAAHDKAADDTADADADADTATDAESESADSAADVMRMAEQYAHLSGRTDAEAEAEKFRIGKALKKVGKFAGKLLKKGLKAGLKAGAKFLKKAAGGALRKGLKGLKGLKKFGGKLGALGAQALNGGLTGALDAAQNAVSSAAGAAADMGFGAGAGAGRGAPMPPGGASLQPPSGMGGASAEQSAGQSAGAGAGAGEPMPPPRPLTAEERAQMAREEKEYREWQREQMMRAGVPNVRQMSAVMPAFKPPVKPWNPLKELRGHNMHYSLVTDPKLTYDQFGAGPIVQRKISKAPTPYLPPCCNLCGVNSGPRLTQPDRYSTCCYYCVRKPYGAKPPRKRLRTSTRPLPKARITIQSLEEDKRKQASGPQDDHADIFSPRPPMVHANRHRFG